MAISLKFKAEKTISGNDVLVANIKGTLLNVSKNTFSYENGNGETITYRLATVKFTDEKGVNHTKEGFVIYENSFEKGMEVGNTYLGRITRSTNADGSARKPWSTLYSLPAGESLSDDDFENVEVTANADSFM